MTAKLSVAAPPGSASGAPQPLRWVKYVFWGGALGLVAGLGATFVLALLDGQAQGLSPGGCFVYGCALTLMLSHPAGLGGMAAGTVVGTLVGVVVYLVRHRPRTTAG